MMTESFHESRRLVLRECPGEPVVAWIAQEAGWALVADNAQGGTAHHIHQQTWDVGHDTYVHMLCDVLSECCALAVASKSLAGMESLTARLEELLNPMSREEILVPVETIADPGERMRTLMRMVLSVNGTPAGFDSEIHEQMVKAAHDPDPRLRDTAVLATAYVAWPQLRIMLRELAEHDPHPEVRQDAAGALRTYDSAGVPEA